MSDLGRKSFADKVEEKVTPESQKSSLEQAKESVTGAADKVASNLTPEEGKSDSQKLGDAIQKGHDDAKAENSKTLADTATEYVEAGKEAINNAAEYVSSTLTGAKEGAANGGKGTSA